MSYTVHNFAAGDIIHAEDLNEMDAQIAANAEGGAVNIDDTLTIAGAAADAKKVGDEIADLQDTIEEISESGISTAGASAGQVPVADGEGGWAWGDVAGGGSSLTSDFDVVDDYAGLLTSTADKVLVLHDNSRYGCGKQCFYEVQRTATQKGYERDDESVVFPMADQGPLVSSTPPIRYLMSVIRTWVGNANVGHVPSGQRDYHGLFCDTVQKDSNNKFTMDCSAFICAVLLGITYEKSRYVLGSSANNITGGILGGNVMPESQSDIRTQGGLLTDELAMWFAAQGRLYTIPDDTEKATQMLQFGDLVFGCNAERNPSRYYNIEHVMFVLGPSESGTGFVYAHINSSPDGTHEQAGAVTGFNNLSDNSYCRVFARPNYSNIGRWGDYIIPKTAGTFKYNAFFLPVTLVLRANDTSISSNSAYVGKLYPNRYASATPDFLPVVPGSTLSYTGDASASDNRGQYIVMVHEYNDKLELIQNTTIAWSGNTAECTLQRSLYDSRLKSHLVLAVGHISQMAMP